MRRRGCSRLSLVIGLKKILSRTVALTEPKGLAPVLSDGAPEGEDRVFVVRIQNDEATMYRAFRRLQTARRWAVESDHGSHDAMFDVFAVEGVDESNAAVAAARSGSARHVVRADPTLTPFLPTHEAMGDIRFSHSAAAGR